MQGKRAMTVRVNDVIGVAGFALPGNFVDIMVNTQEEGKGSNRDANDTSVSKIVLEHILVLAVAQEAGRDESKPKVVNAVTLEVTPERSREARPRAQRRHAVAGAAQPDRSQARTVHRGDQGDAARHRPPGAAWCAKTTLVPTVATVQPAARKATPPAKAAAPRECVLVISGKDISRECF